MKSLLVGLATGIAVVVLAVQLFGALLLMGVLDTPDDRTDDLLPPLNGPLYLPGEKETADAQYMHDHCLSAANAVYGSNRNEPIPRARITEYLACYIGELEEDPKRLCEPDTHQRLIRYTRGYFAFLDARKKEAETPVLQPMLKMQRDLQQRSNIVMGKDDFSPDPRILEGLQALVREGALQPDIERELEPEVPEDVIDALTAIRPEKAICS